jgi:hypothetical protein
LLWIHSGAVAMAGKPQPVASAYQSEMGKPGSRSATTQGSRWGTGDVRIVDVSAHAREMGPGLGYDVLVTMSIDPKVRVEHAIYWVMLVDGAGFKLAGASTLREPALVRVLDGPRRVECRLANLPLLPGDYSVTAAVFDRSLVPLDRWGDCVTVSIEADECDEGLLGCEYDGVIRASSHWTEGSEN